MLERMRSRPTFLAIFLCCWQTVRASDCDVGKFITPAIHGRMSTEKVLSTLASLEKKIEILYPQIFNGPSDVYTERSKKLDQLSGKLGQLLDLLDDEGSKNELIAAESAALKQELYEFESEGLKSLQAAENQSAEFPMEKSIDELQSLTEIELKKNYRIPSEGHKELKVNFSERAMKELFSGHISARVRQKIFDALKKGVVSAKNFSGIKLMKNHQGVPFAEVKTTKNEAGAYRLYGRLVRNVIHFLFLGTEMTSANDNQRKVIAKSLRKI